MNECAAVQMGARIQKYKRHACHIIEILEEQAHVSNLQFACHIMWGSAGGIVDKKEWDELTGERHHHAPKPHPMNHCRHACLGRS